MAPAPTSDLQQYLIQRLRGQPTPTVPDQALPPPPQPMQPMPPPPMGQPASPPAQSSMSLQPLAQKMSETLPTPNQQPIPIDFGMNALKGAPSQIPTWNSLPIQTRKQIGVEFLNKHGRFPSSPEEAQMYMQQSYIQQMQDYADLAAKLSTVRANNLNSTGNFNADMARAHDLSNAAIGKQIGNQQDLAAGPARLDYERNKALAEGELGNARNAEAGHYNAQTGEIGALLPYKTRAEAATATSKETQANIDKATMGAQISKGNLDPAAQQALIRERNASANKTELETGNMPPPDLDAVLKDQAEKFKTLQTLVDLKTNGVEIPDLEKLIKNAYTNWSQAGNTVEQLRKIKADKAPTAPSGRSGAPPNQMQSSAPMTEEQIRKAHPDATDEEIKAYLAARR